MVRSLYFAIVALLALLCQTGLAAEKPSVAATVNGVEITTEQVKREVERLIPLNTYHRNLSEDRVAEFSQKALDNLIIAELQYQEAKKRGLKPDGKEVKKQMAQVRDRFSSKKEYKAALERSGMDEDELRSIFERSVLVQMLTDEIATKPSRMTDSALKEYYDKNQDKFVIPESVNVRLITIRDEKKAREAAAKIAAGERFDDVAARMSEDKFRVMGGSLGFVHKGQIVEALEEPVFRSPVNEMKGPLKAGDTWIMFIVEEKRPAVQMSFDESKDKLRKDLEAKRAAELQEKWIVELKAKATIEIKKKDEPTEAKKPL